VKILASAEPKGRAHDPLDPNSVQDRRKWPLKAHTARGGETPSLIKETRPWAILRLLHWKIEPGSYHVKASEYDETVQW
jgi:hypothetical protein